MTIQNLKHLRDLLWCSQENLSNYLEISLSALAMAETNSRSLTPQAWGEYTRMKQCYDMPDQPGHLGDVYIVEQKRRRREWMQEELAKAQSKLLILTKQFESLKAAFDRGCNALRFISRIDKQGDDDVQQHRSLLLGTMSSAVIVRTNKSGLIEQAILEMEIEALKLRISMMTELINEA